MNQPPPSPKFYNDRFQAVVLGNLSVEILFLYVSGIRRALRSPPTLKAVRCCCMNQPLNIQVLLFSATYVFSLAQVSSGDYTNNITEGHVSVCTFFAI